MDTMYEKYILQKSCRWNLHCFQVFCFHTLAFQNKGGTAKYSDVTADKGYNNLIVCNLYKTVHEKLTL